MDITGIIQNVSVANGGSSYVLNDVIIITGGDDTAALLVTGVSSGIITAVEILVRGTTYNIANNVATTGGHGSGALINITSIYSTSTEVSTQFLLPGYVVSNGQVTGNPWSFANNILYVDGNLTESNPAPGVASDLIIGGFNPNIPSNAVVYGVEIELIAKQGGTTIPATTLTLYAVDNTSGQDVFFPYTAPVGLTNTLTTYSLGSPTYLFGQLALTPNQINNLKISLTANGDIYVDSVLIKVFYSVPVPPTPATPIAGGCPSCNSPIQVPAMYLQLPFLAGQTVFYLQPGSLQYADGTPVQPGDVGECGGEIDFVFDEGQIKTISNNNFEENVTLDLSSGYWIVLPTGVVEVNIGSTSNRGLLPHYPYTSNSGLMSDHDANSKVIISNNGKFYSRFARLCALGTPVYNEIVSGSSTTFTLANIPQAGSVRVYGGGSRLTLGADYTINYSTGVITTTNAYASGQVVADYQM